MPAGFHRHLVGKTLRNVCYSDVIDSVPSFQPMSRTSHTATGTQVERGITQCHLPSGSGDIPAFTTAEPVLASATPEGCKAELTSKSPIPSFLPRDAIVACAIIRCRMMGCRIFSLCGCGLHSWYQFSRRIRINPSKRPEPTHGLTRPTSNPLKLRTHDAAVLKLVVQWIVSCRHHFLFSSSTDIHQYT